MISFIIPNISFGNKRHIVLQFDSFYTMISLESESQSTRLTLQKNISHFTSNRS
ncbi:hypothetical protein HMPREF9145_0482 [Segatella salivae F0493]|uniref:Lipoprotein n=1 Tax=Segatella salivae F0493 TaxID=1395125 RepID=U2MKP8_9BACT|nr:hypothetical protein HMPREF9145_0482 [Segatella salivae F0493]